MKAALEGDLRSVDPYSLAERILGDSGGQPRQAAARGTAAAARSRAGEG